MQWSRNNRENAIDQLFISVIHVKQNFSGLTSDILFVLKVFNHSISQPILILHLLHFEFITVFSLFLAESVKICVPRGCRDMFFFDQQGYCGCDDFGVKEKDI